MDIAFLLLGPVLFCFWVGMQLDQKYSPEFPFWTIVCTFLGFITGMWSIYKRYVQ